MAQNDGVYVFQDPNSNKGMSDLATIAALSGNGFGGGMNNPFWMMFMLPFLYPFFNMFGGWGNGNWGGFGGVNGGTGFLANQLNNDAGRDLILQAINGRADALGQLAQILNTSVETVKNGINSVATSIVTMDGNVKLTGAQIINSIQSGNTALAQQLAQCCCENRLAICQQTNALQSEAARNHADLILQMAKNEGADQLAVCQQTNQLGSQADRNTNNILTAIANQNAMLEQRFCEIKEREMQSKIDTQGDIITQLRGQISNDKQTEAFNAAINALNEKIATLAAKQPNTVPVQYPNLVAVNATPYGGGYGYNFGNGFGGGIVF